MEKEFFDVFPSLKLKDQLKEWLEMVTVSRVTCNPAKTRLWVYIHSERWIHKKFIFALEDQIERQCFPGMEMRVTVIERFICRSSILRRISSRSTVPAWNWN